MLFSNFSNDILIYVYEFSSPPSSNQCTDKREIENKQHIT